MKRNNILKELVFKAVRSGGKGGQNVNKVSSKVELRFDLFNSKAIDDNEKHILLTGLKKYISQDGVLILNSEKERSQYLNKKSVTLKFLHLIEKALIPKKIRVKTKPTAGSEARKKETKINRSIVKQNRKKITDLE